VRASAALDRLGARQLVLFWVLYANRLVCTGKLTFVVARLARLASSRGSVELIAVLVFFFS
jgi:hypothetical protein